MYTLTCISCNNTLQLHNCSYPSKSQKILTKFGWGWVKTKGRYTKLRWFCKSCNPSIKG